MTFTLHLRTTTGELSEAVASDTDSREAFTSSHASTARAAARKYAETNNADVVVVRDGNRPCYVVTASGAIQPPPGVEVPERAACTKGGESACFCHVCRAERRDARNG